MFDKSSLTRLLYSVLLAAMLTMLALVLTTEHARVVWYLLKGMGTGAVLWLLGEILFSLCERLSPRRAMLGYIVIALLILLGTAGFCYLYGVTDVAVIAIIVAVAEANGMGITAFYRRKYIRELNEKLARSKENL